MPNEDPAEVLPGVPVNFTAEAVDSTTIRLAWDPISGSRGYNLYRGDSADGPFALIANVSGTQYTDSGLLPGTTYYYRVRALTESGDSVVASATTPELAPPWRETQYTCLRITWPEDPCGRGYAVYRSVNGCCEFRFAGRTEENSYLDCGILPGRLYDYRIYSDRNGRLCPHFATRSDAGFPA